MRCDGIVFTDSALWKERRMTREVVIAVLQEEIDGNLELTIREWRERDEQRLFPALRMAIEALTEPKTIIGIDIPYGSDKGLATVFKGNEKMVLEEVKEIMAVVRCKDCRFAMIRTEEEMNKTIKPQPILCEWFCIGVENDDYCSHGERANQTEYKLPGYDEVMDALDKMTLRGDKDE